MPSFTSLTVSVTGAVVYGNDRRAGARLMKAALYGFDPRFADGNYVPQLPDRERPGGAYEFVHVRLGHDEDHLVHGRRRREGLERMDHHGLALKI